MSEPYELKHWTRGSNHSFVQMEHNTAYPGRRMKPGGIMIAIVPEGICVNGDYGVNPSAEEMREMVEVMREAVASWDKLQHE